MANNKMPLEERKAVPVQSSVRLNVFKEVERLAERERVSVSEITRRALHDYVIKQTG